MKTDMEKEIFSEGEILEKIKKTYIKNFTLNLGFSFLENEFSEIKFIASGSSYNAARLGCKFFEHMSDKRVSFEYASEFISNPGRKIKKDTMYCFISQSGETYDTTCALDIVLNEGGHTFGLVNNSNSTIYKKAEFKLSLLAGVETSVAATKSFLASVVCIFLFALAFAKSEGKEIKTRIIAIDEAINAVYDVLSNINEIDAAAKILYKKRKLSIIGYDVGYILAKEGALKIKETSYIDISAYPTGEFLHGHSAVLNKNKTLIEIFTAGLTPFEEATLQKIKNDFNPNIIAITDKNVRTKKAIKFKKYNSEIAKVCAIAVILQLLALKIAKNAGLNVDKPKGLKKVLGKITG